jgi:hypothetical protein
VVVEPASGFVVQVSTQRSEADAQASYRSLQQKYAPVLDGRDPIILRVDLGASGGVFYRAQVGPFRTSEQASTLCDLLKIAGGQCLVRPAAAAAEARRHAQPAQQQQARSDRGPAASALGAAAPGEAAPPGTAMSCPCVVQVAARKTEEEVRAAYRSLQQEFPSLLGERDLAVRRADLGRLGIWYRAELGPFRTFQQAMAFCERLKAAGGVCLVQRN